MKIAIHKNDKVFKHSTNWSNDWINYCEKEKIDYKIVDCFDNDIIRELKNFDVLLWHFSNYSFLEMMVAKNVLYSAKKIGLKIFPDFNEAWHFDDKLAEAYLLQAIEAPIPETFFFYSFESVKEFINKNPKFPLVAKLKNGSGSHNVKLIKDSKDLLKYSKKMFGKGISPSPSLLFKTKSNIQSSKNMSDFKSKAKRIPEFLKTLKNAKKFPNERGYVYLQEFIPNDGFDLKIVTIGEKLSFIVRPIRKNDFRASGGGALLFDKTKITADIIKSAFEVSDKLNFNCMGYDYVFDNKENKGKIIEMSYGFSHKALLKANGFFDKNGFWYNQPLNAPEEIIKNLINEER